MYRALTFLVTSCPCALVVSIPLSFFAGIGGASKEGVLIKGSNYLETLSQVKTVVFDKTGTLTKGVFEVSAVHHSPMEQEKLLEYAALAECASSHPISKSLQKAYGKRSTAAASQTLKKSAAEAFSRRSTAFRSPPATTSSWSSWVSTQSTATVLERSSIWPSMGSTPGTL